MAERRWAPAETCGYAETIPASEAPSSAAPTLTPGAPGQAIAVSLNGNPGSGGVLSPLEAANSIVIAARINISGAIAETVRIGSICCLFPPPRCSIPGARSAPLERRS